MNNSEKLEEIEFLLENIFFESADLIIKLITGINLVAFLEEHKRYLPCVKIIQKIIFLYKNKIDVTDFYNKL